MPIAFTKVKLPHGWLGNMAPFPVQFDGKSWKTTEHLFQALRFQDDASREELRGVPSPMGVKMRAKRIARQEPAKVVVEKQSQQDLVNMEMVLRLKLDQYPKLGQILLGTGEETIIEDCTNRPGGSGKFWGAQLKNGEWVGENMLGKMWMKLREELKQETLQSNKWRN